MSVTIRKNSFLRFGQTLLVDGIEFWEVVDLPTIPVQPDDIQYTVQAVDRLDTLAYRFYKNPILKWVIMAANDLEIEPSDLNEGQLLRIPAPRYVLQVLFSKAPQLRRR
jgi:nucleoid-associated protein YgaU